MTKYVIYIHDETDGDNDSFFCEGKEELDKQLRILKRDYRNKVHGWKATKVCKLVKGEYVPTKYA